MQFLDVKCQQLWQNVIGEEKKLTFQVNQSNSKQRKLASDRFEQSPIFPRKLVF